MMMLAGFGLAVSSAFVAGAHAQIQLRNANMDNHALGTFDVTMTPKSPPEDQAGVTIGHLLNQKTYRGELTGTGSGEMFIARSGVKGSAAYVLIERVTGLLHGRRGTFVLLHSAIMKADEPMPDSVMASIVPDSGTDELTGIAGAMTIRIENDRHHYDLAYAL
jgi:hypothetical protein